MIFKNEITKNKSIEVSILEHDDEETLLDFTFVYDDDNGFVFHLILLTYKLFCIRIFDTDK